MVPSTLPVARTASQKPATDCTSGSRQPYCFFVVSSQPGRAATIGA